MYSSSGVSNQNYEDTIFEKFVELFRTSIVRKEFKFFGSFIRDRVQRNRIHVKHEATKIFCVIQIDVDANIVESSQIIRDYLLQEPIC